MGSDDENVQRKRILIIITDEEWDVRKLKASDTLNSSISSEADVEEETVRAARRSVSAHPEKHFARRALGGAPLRPLGLRRDVHHHRQTRRLRHTPQRRLRQISALQGQ